MRIFGFVYAVCVTVAIAVIFSFFWFFSMFH